MALPMGARPLPGYDGGYDTTITERGRQNGRITLVHGLKGPGQGDIRSKQQAAALVVHERSSAAIRLPGRAGTNLVRAEICNLGWLVLQPAHPGAIRRSAPANKSIASSIEATTREKSIVQLVSGDSGRSGRSVITQPPTNRNSRLASSSAPSTWAMSDAASCVDIAYLLDGGCEWGGQLGPPSRKKDGRILELHRSWNSSAAPVVDPLNCAARPPPQLFSQARGSSVMINKLSVCHKHRLYTFCLF
jgi:hypothetical protein